MSEEKTAATGNQEQKALFTGLIMMLGSSAMQQLGKLIDPATSKTEVSLEGAQSTIDLLDMLKAKTQGNLDAEEEKMLRDLLASLQMNYVQAAETMKKKPAEPAPEPAAGTDAASEPPAEGKASAETSAAASEEDTTGRQPKFHKSYGG